MAKSLRCKREKRLRAIKRDLVEPIYEKKEAAKLAVLEAALAAPKLPVRSTNAAAAAAAMDATTSASIATNADMDVEMADGNQSTRSLKPMGKKMKRKLQIGKKKYRGKGKIRRKHNV